MAKFAFKNKVLPSVMAATLASGMTLSGNANAIHLADNGIGQTLLGPVYLVNYGYTTKVSIVNTRNDVAVKAKIVIRSSVNGIELLDFLCYLSPADVCRFEIREQDIDGDGNPDVVMYSDDDSIKSPVPTNVSGLPLVNSMEKSRATFASIRPVTQELHTHKLRGNDTERMGHIEVIGVYGVKGTVTGYSPRSGQDPKPVSITVERGMSKFALAQIFDTPRNEESNEKFWQPVIPLALANQPTELTERMTGAKAPYSRLTASRIRSTDPSWVQLTGEVELVSPIDRIGYRFAALAGSIGDNVPVDSGNVRPYSVPSGLPIPLTAVWDGLVVSNPKYDASIANETGIGELFGIQEIRADLVGDKTVEIEAALATTHIIDTFEDTSNATHDLLGKRTRMLVTFPTRYRHFEHNFCSNSSVVARQYSEPFQSNGAASYSLTALNNFEQTPGTYRPPELTGTPFSGGKIEEEPEDEDPLIKGLTEVNYFFPDWPQTEVDESGKVLHNVIDFRSGWFDMELLAKGGCGNYYPGIPALGFTHKYVETGNGYTQSWFVSAGHKPVLCCDTGQDGTDSCPSTSW